MEKTNKIITIDRKLVRVAYTGAANHCNRCCIKGARCRVRLEPCKKYNDPNSPLHAIFVPAEDIEADTTAQARPVPADVQEAAEKAALHYDMGTEGVAYQDGYKDGMLAERERLMKEAPVADVIEMRGRTENGYPLEITLGFTRLPNIEYHGGAVRVIIEEIK